MKAFGFYEFDFDRACHVPYDIYRLAMVMAEFGIETSQLLQDSMISVSDLSNPKATISMNQKLKVYQNALALAPCPDLGLVASQSVKITDFGLLGYTVICAETFQDAIHYSMKYLKLASPVLHQSFRLIDNVARFEGLDHVQLGELLPFCTEFWFGSIYALCSQCLQKPVRNICIRLPYPDPGYGDKYRELFQCDVLFDTGVIQWDFDASLLTDKIPSANALAAKMCLQSCDSMLATLNHRDTLDQQVKAFLLENPGKFPDAAQVAAHFGLSTRTLSRRLHNLNVSYQNLLNDTRKAIALQYLQSTALSVEEIATLTGFSDASNFRRAFKKWTGTTPNHIRMAC